MIEVNKMKTIEIRSQSLKPGSKIVPITEKSRSAVLAKAAELAQDSSVDAVEWRIDKYEDVFEIRFVIMPEMISAVRQALGDKIFMYTFRDKHIGGEHPATCMYVTRLNDLASAPGLADLITVEWYAEPDAAAANIENIHAAGKLAVASWFAQGEVGREDIVRKLESMLEGGANVLEYGVKPESAAELDAAIAAFKVRNPDTLIIRSVISENGEEKTVC